MSPRSLRVASGLALLVCALPVHAQRDATVERVLELGKSDNRVEQHLEYLTRTIGPRLTSSSNLTRACEWARAKFASFGLVAHMEPWGEWPVGFDRHFMKGGMVAPARADYVFTTPSWTPGTAGPTRGLAVLEPTTLAELDALRAAPNVWLVRRTRATPPRGGGGGDSRAGTTAAATAAGDAQPAAAASDDAAAAARKAEDKRKADEKKQIDAALAELPLLGEIRGTGDLVHTSGNQNIAWDKLPTRVKISLRKDQHADLMQRLTEGQPVELEFDLDQRFVRGPVALYNVWADLVGSEKPDEYVIVGGHIDSWDGAQGAQDNGTGVSTTLEAARLLTAAGAKPRRTIRFMLWSGEEQGLLGSEAWVKSHLDLMPKISAVLVHDAGTNYLSGLAGPPALMADLKWATGPLFELDERFPFNVRENKGLSAFGASDHASFTQQGVPGLFWAQDGETSYDYVHHTQHDTFENARQDYQRHSSMVVAVTAYNLASLDHLLDRTGLLQEGGGRRDSTRRFMGVQLEDTTVAAVNAGGMAETAGWKEGDVVLSIDGVEVATRRDISTEINKGGPRKVVKLKRGAETIESVLDYSGSASEEARAKAAAKEALDKVAPAAPAAPESAAPAATPAAAGAQRNGG